MFNVSLLYNPIIDTIFVLYKSQHITSMVIKKAVNFVLLRINILYPTFNILFNAVPTIVYHVYEFFSGLFKL